MKLSSQPPPWLHDSNPELWVSASIAAQFYFKKSRSTIKRMIKDGTLLEAGILSYWDGSRWFLRLPQQIAPFQNIHKHQSVR